MYIFLIESFQREILLFLFRFLFPYYFFYRYCAREFSDTAEPIYITFPNLTGIDINIVDFFVDDVTSFRKISWIYRF